MKRREFLLQAGALAAGATLPARPLEALTRRWGAAGGVALVCDPADALVASAPARWAVEQLRSALVAGGAAVRVLPRLGDARPDERCLVVAGGSSPLARDSGLALPAGAESLAIGPGRVAERPVLFALGRDVRGLVYALTELADDVAIGAGPEAALSPATAVIETPANAVRSVIRLHTSDVEDNPWFNDRDFWQGYLGMLVAQRFNRVNLSFGLGYDQPQELADTYFYFTYPFLLKVPGYPVRATNLPDAERDRNLEMLRWISDEAAARGLQFQLGLWTHAWRWVNSPNANHVIEGLTPATHGPYCRDALALLLRECPNVTGVTIRIHGESGVPEGSYDFWRTIFQGAALGRHVPLDLHAKGIDQPTIDAALAAGVPLTISPKFWAEHMGLPYHQAAIRPTEVPTGRPGQGPFTHSEGDRSFTRYGYADLLRQDRRYDVVHRIWPGTQRVLLWADPAFAAAYGRAASFCGSAGAEVFDPMSFKGRKGSGLPGGRDGYADLSLRAPGPDFEKYRQTYRVWGRAFYHPEAPPERWRRQLRHDYGRAAPAVEVALASAGRLLPLVTTAHDPSAANNHFWPEMYLNMAIADPTVPVMPYPDTPEPRRFGTVSPLDPQLFSRIEDFADELLARRKGAKYSPAEVAAWLDRLAAAAAQALASARASAPDPRAPAFRRFDIDTGVQIGLGRFFARKLRAGVLFALYSRTGDAALLRAALDAYRAARAEWARVAQRTAGVYVKDLTYGPAWYQRGHWADRIAAIDKDIAAVEHAAPAPGATPVGAERAAALLREVLGPAPRPQIEPTHAPPPSFRRGQPLELELSLPAGAAASSVTLHFRRVTQAEAWQASDMPPRGSAFKATIPGEYTGSPYPLQYYFEIGAPNEPPRLHPGLGPDLTRQPYFVVRAG